MHACMVAGMVCAVVCCVHVCVHVHMRMSDTQTYSLLIQLIKTKGAKTPSSISESKKLQKDSVDMARNSPRSIATANMIYGINTVCGRDTPG